MMTGITNANHTKNQQIIETIFCRMGLLKTATNRA